MKDKKVWVSSKTGRAVHLIDTSIIVDGDNVRICIDSKMAEQNIPIEVPLTKFIETMSSESMNTLEIWRDEVAAKQKHDGFFKGVTEEQKKVDKDKSIQDKATEIAIKKAKDAFEAEMSKVRESSEKPKVIRRKAGEK